MVTAGLPLHHHPDGVLVEIWVVPGAGRSEVTGLHAGALRVRVGAPAEGGRANGAAAALVARVLGGRRGEVIAGASSRRKRVLVPGVLLEDAGRRLELVLGVGGATR